MPTFKQVKAWIREAADAYNVYLPVQRLKALSGAYLDSLEYNPLTYTDETGEEACKRWFMAVSHA